MDRRIATVARISILVMAFVTCCYCILRGNGIQGSPRLKAIRLTSSIPVRGPEGKTYSRKDTIDIFYYEDMTMYRMPVTKNYSRTQVDRSGDIVKDSVEKVTVEYRYIVCHKTQPYGIRYDSMQAGPGRRIRIDSFLSGKWISQVSKLVENIEVNDSLVYSRLENGTLTERYTRRMNVDPTYADSVILSYSGELKDVSYSFSEKMDGLRQMKLFCINIVYNKERLRGPEQSEDDFRFAFERLVPDHPEKIVALFENFRKIATNN